MKHSIYILSISAFFTFQTHQQGAEIQKIEEIVKEEAKKVVNEFTFFDGFRRFRKNPRSKH